MSPLLLPALLVTAPVIVDTDAGTDDLMAISFLLRHPGVRVEAITVVNGLAHPRQGALNIIRLLELAGHRDIPVYAGRDKPVSGAAAFPIAWRNTSDNLPGVQLPQPRRKPRPETASGYLARRLSDTAHPVAILALGPLTNLAEALGRAPEAVRTVERMVIMGGALRVPGNLGDGGFYKTGNTRAEWNIFIDPEAARMIFAAGFHITLVPLDATNQVRIGPDFLQQVLSAREPPLRRFIGQILDAERDMIEQKTFFAWDPLAAVALLDPEVLKTVPLAVEIRPDGTMVEVASARPNVTAALGADAAKFKSEFLNAF